jgi:hypothetical protein
MLNIQPVVFPIVGTATKLAVTVLGFPTSAKDCGTYYALLTDANVKIIEGNYQLTEAEFAAWGTDNNYINDIVANYLNVTIIK